MANQTLTLKEVGESWRFKQADLERWIEDKKKTKGNSWHS
jgi:hypothetical protein